MQINGHEISHTRPCYIVAEMSCNHEQDKQQALKLIDAADFAGADAVKVQTYMPRELSGGNKEKEKFYEGTYTPWDWIPELMAHAKELGITLFSTPATVKGVDWLESCGVPAYKVASCDHANWDLLLAIERTGKPVIVSTGMAEKRDIWNIAALFEPSRVALLKCTSAYPCPPADVHLSTMADMILSFPCPVGYSDHTKGHHIALVAVALGACIIEKHFYLEGTEPIDEEFSINQIEFRLMVNRIRATESAIGKIEYGFRESEEAVRWLKELKSGATSV